MMSLNRGLAAGETLCMMMMRTEIAAGQVNLVCIWLMDGPAFCFAYPSQTMELRDNIWHAE
jgi:hypothetical protein